MAREAEVKSAAQGWREVKCLCGATTILVAPGMEITLTCWLCPHNTPERPNLRLVKPDA